MPLMPANTRLAPAWAQKLDRYIRSHSASRLKTSAPSTKRSTRSLTV